VSVNSVHLHIAAVAAPSPPLPMSSLDVYVGLSHNAAYLNIYFFLMQK